MVASPWAAALTLGFSAATSIPYPTNRAVNKSGKYGKYGQQTSVD
jgi:hypothetical protein